MHSILKCRLSRLLQIQTTRSGRMHGPFLTRLDQQKIIDDGNAQRLLQLPALHIVTAFSHYRILERKGIFTTICRNLSVF